MATAMPPVYGLPPDLVRGDEYLAAAAPTTWHLPRDVWDPIRANPQARGRGIRVAVLDTGYYAHPLLPKPVATRSFVPGQAVHDGNGHGTHCAGTVLARDPNIGVAMEADLLVGKVLSNGGSGDSEGITQGVLWAISEGAHVISMSLGGGGRYEPLVNAIRKALSLGVIVCCSAGNSGFNGRTNTIGYPARAGESVCVAALRSDGRPSGFSSGGEQMTVAAPGEQILSCAHRGAGLVFMSGTSMSCPFVAGCHAVLLGLMRKQGKPSLLGIQAVNSFIQQNARDILAPGRDPQSGFGVYDMLDVVKRAASDELKFV